MKLGEFELGTLLGEGGMGKVWAGRHAEANVDVAIKVMRPEVMDDPEFREAFEMEVRSVASLDHPNIVTILDFGVTSPQEAEESSELEAGSPYLVMEYAHGGAVGDYYRQLRWPDMRELLLVILDALSHAHAREVIHRDLKPENILVGCGPNWDVKLTDFGLAHASDRFDDEGKVETAWGTPQYMAPEQLRGLWREYGPWTDLYGLGCMAYELICGKWPFDGKTVVEIGNAHINSPIPPLTPRFEVPDGTEEWIRRLLEKQRSRRFAHAADAAYGLAQLPAFDDKERFGVLFQRPTSAPGAPDLESDDKAAATLMLPGLNAGPTQESPSARLSIRNWDGSGTDVHDIEALLPSGVPPLPLSWRHRQEGLISNELMGISLGLFGLRAIPLVDRNDERDRMWRLLHEVSNRGEALQLVVEGAAGTGKSELVRWMCRRAREVGGARVLTAYHSPVSGPADGLVPMMERFLKCARLQADKVETHLTKMLIAEGLAKDFDLRALLALFEIADVGEGDSGRFQSVGREERYAIIYRFLSLLARRRPVIVWLDDVQWGLDALGFADYVRRRQATNPAPILLVMTARTEALSERPSEERALRALIEAPQVHQKVLAPLEEDDLDELVRRLLRLDDDLADHLLQRSEGVPLFAVQLVSDWVARGKLWMSGSGFALKPGADVAIPDDLHQLWDSRVTGFLSMKAPETLHYLELAAALGHEVDHDEWMQAQLRAGMPRIGGLVERLVEEDLARIMEGGWRFAHGMMQESLERSAREAGRWETWNSRCAQALEDLYEGDAPQIPDRLAWHWIEAEEPEKALGPLALAIDQSIARSDYDQALDLIEWREEITDSARWAVVNAIDTARVEARRGAYRLCAELAEGAVESAKKDGFSDLVSRAKVWAGVGRRALGDLQEAERLLSSAGESLAEGSDKSLLAQCVLELGRVNEQRGDFELARRHFEHGRSIFAELDDDFGGAQCLNAIGDVTRQSGDFDAAQRASFEALELYKSLGNISGIADCLNDLAEWSRMQGELDDAEEFADEARRLYSAVGSADEHFVRLNLAMIFLEKGKYSDAATVFDDLIEVFDGTGQTALSAQARAGMVAANAGRYFWPGFEETLREVQQSLGATGVRAPLAIRALSLASQLAAQAGKSEFAELARSIAQNQTQGMRQTMSQGDEVE